MIVETVAMIAAGLADESHGVNAQISALTSAGAWSAESAPPVVSVVTPYGDLYAAVGDAPASLPAVTVACVGFEPFEPFAHVGLGRDARLTIAVRYDGEDDDPLALQRNAALTMRAVLRSIAWYCAESPGTARESGKVQFIQGDQVRLGEIEVDQQANPTTLAALLSCSVRDIA